MGKVAKILLCLLGVLCVVGIAAGFLIKADLERKILAAVNATHVTVMGVPAIINVAGVSINPWTAIGGENGRVVLHDVHVSLPSAFAYQAREIAAYGLPARFVLSMYGFGSFNMDELYIPHVVISEQRVDSKEGMGVSAERCVLFETTVRTRLIDGFLRGKPTDADALLDGVGFRGFEMDDIALFGVSEGEEQRYATLASLVATGCEPGHLGSLAAERFSIIREEGRLEIGAVSFSNVNIPSDQTVAMLSDPKALASFRASGNSREIVELLFFGDKPVYERLNMAGLLLDIEEFSLSVDTCETRVGNNNTLASFIRGLSVSLPAGTGFKIPNELSLNADFTAVYGVGQVVSDAIIDISGLGRMSLHGVQPDGMLACRDFSLVYQDQGGIAWLAANFVDDQENLEKGLKETVAGLEKHAGENPDTRAMVEALCAFIERPGVIEFRSRPGTEITLDAIPHITEAPGRWFLVTTEAGQTELKAQVEAVIASWNASHR
ncbi:MAG: hypothetical protein E7022_00345 [Desulfovibrio desulfuricans]|nr:hypothetical protein [Desulfovibrio desulfuricans]